MGESRIFPLVNRDDPLMAPEIWNALSDAHYARIDNLMCVHPKMSAFEAYRETRSYRYLAENLDAAIEVITERDRTIERLDAEVEKLNDSLVAARKYMR